MSLHINKTYKSTVRCVRIYFLLGVTLNDLADANALAKDAEFKNYDVTISANQVEVEGALNWFDVCDIVDMKDLIDHGMGCFNHGVLPNCKMLWAERLVTNKNRSNSHLVADNNLTYSNTINVIFEGQVLPHYVLFFLRRGFEFVLFTQIQCFALDVI